MATDSATTYFLVTGCFVVIASALFMVWITSRTGRLPRRVAGMTFWTALALQQTDVVLTYLFNSYAGEFATVRGSWHLVAIGFIGAIALFFWTIFLYLDQPQQRESRSSRRELRR